MHKHRYAPVEYHAVAVATVAMIFIIAKFVSPYETDVTGIIVFPLLFCGVTLRAVWDWLYIVYTVISQIAKYIFAKFARKEATVNG